MGVDLEYLEALAGTLSIRSGGAVREAIAEIRQHRKQAEVRAALRENCMLCGGPTECLGGRKRICRKCDLLMGG
jgi:hypothetical protein